MQSRWQEKLWQCSVLVSYHVVFYNIMCYFVWCRHVCQEMNIAKRRTPGMLSELRIDVVSVLLLVLLSVPYTSCFHGLAHFTCRHKGEHRSFFSPKCEITLIHTDTMPAQPIPDHAEDYIPRYGSTLGYISSRDTTWHYLTMTTHRMSLDRITLITHIRDPTCMHACRRHFLIEYIIITVWVHLTYNIIHRVT